MKVGVLCYLHSLPFYWRPIPSVTMVKDTPAGLFQAIKTGRLDMSFLPVMAEKVLPIKSVNGLGIAAQKKVDSVVVCYKNYPAKTYYLTPESLTSVTLLKLLCWLEGIPFETGYDENRADAFLFIGDLARSNFKRKTWKAKKDLAQWWHEKTGLPFVFARIYTRDHVEIQKAKEVIDALKQNVRDFFQTDHFCSMGAGEKAYLGHIRYELKKADFLGLKTFFTCLEEHDAATRIR